MSFRENVVNQTRSTGNETLVQAGQERFKCDLCPKSYRRRENLKRHFQWKHTNGEDGVRYKCELCEKNFCSYDSLETHINAHLKLKPYKCEICSRRFTVVSALKRHKKFVHSSGLKMRKWKCSKCVNKSYLWKSNLDDHFKSVHEGVRYSCPSCSTSFKTKQGFKYHQLIHQGDRHIECQKCPKKFRQIGDLNIHFKRKHVGKTAKTHKCNYCSKTFFTRTELKDHLVVHTNDSPHSCVICSKAFGRRKDLEKHMRTHTLERPYKCLQCPMAFARKDHLQNHQRSKHGIGGDAFTCVFCNLKCVTKFQLQEHYLRHVQEKPYSCKQRCGKSFCFKRELKRHLKTHRTINERE